MIEPGDILLYKPNDFDIIGWIIQFFSKKHRYCHSAIAVNTHQIIESDFNRGVIKSYLNKEKKFDIYRLNKSVLGTVNDMDNGYSKHLMVENANKIYLKQMRYGLKIGIGQFINEVIDDLIPSFRNMPPIIYDENEMNCSQLIATIFMATFGYGLIPGVHSLNIKPDDIQDSPYLTKYSEFRNGTERLCNV